MRELVPELSLILYVLGYTVTYILMICVIYTDQRQTEKWDITSSALCALFFGNLFAVPWPILWLIYLDHILGDR